MLINPLAGIGGPKALKGSDNCQPDHFPDSSTLSRSELRAQQFLEALGLDISMVEWVTVARQMGENCLKKFPIKYSLIPFNTPELSSSQDSIEASLGLKNYGVDLLIFVGGDGTARDVYKSLDDRLPALGIPAGVKMHSAIFAINPTSGAELLKKIISGALVNYESREIRDIDEAALQSGIVKSRYYAEACVPVDTEYLQSVKHGGGETDEFGLIEIAEEIKRRIEELEKCMLIFAPGSTVDFIQKELNCEGTLLGVDVAINGNLKTIDATSEELERMVLDYDGTVRMIITPIGGQGHIIGRGNQQISPTVLKKVTRENIWIVATERKIRELEHRPMFLDSNDPELDTTWSGLIPVITGYNSQILYRLTC